MTKPFNVRDIKDLPDLPEATIGDETIPYALPLTEQPKDIIAKAAGVELGKLRVFRSDATERTLITFVEDGGYPMLRISSGGQSQDLVLNLEQIKLLLSQMVLWITR